MLTSLIGLMTTLTSLMGLSAENYSRCLSKTLGKRSAEDKVEQSIKNARDELWNGGTTKICIQTEIVLHLEFIRGGGLQDWQFESGALAVTPTPKLLQHWGDCIQDRAIHSRVFWLTSNKNGGRGYDCLPQSVETDNQLSDAVISLKTPFSTLLLTPPGSCSVCICTSVIVFVLMYL